MVEKRVMERNLFIILYINVFVYVSRRSGSMQTKRGI